MMIMLLLQKGEAARCLTREKMRLEGPINNKMMMMVMAEDGVKAKQKSLFLSLAAAAASLIYTSQPTLASRSQQQIRITIKMATN
jgi:hypothetical protein